MLLLVQVSSKSRDLEAKIFTEESLDNRLFRTKLHTFRQRVRTWTVLWATVSPVASIITRITLDRIAILEPSLQITALNTRVNSAAPITGRLLLKFKSFWLYKRILRVNFGGVQVECVGRVLVGSLSVTKGLSTSSFHSFWLWHTTRVASWVCATQGSNKV